NRFRWLRLEENAQPGGLTVHIGRFLCGNPLVDYDIERRRLIAFDPQAVGYEMESYGIAAEARQRDVPWVLVKAISDWGNGLKKRKKEGSQKLASHNAAE